MKQRGTYLVPTLIAGESLGEKIDKGMYLPPPSCENASRPAARSQMFQHALAKGVKIGFGTDGRGLSTRPQRGRVPLDG